MAILAIENLKKLIENVPNDFTIEFDKGNTTAPDDRVEIDISGKNLFLNEKIYNG